MIRFAYNILVLLGLMVSVPAQAAPDLNPYALQMASSMQRVVSGESFQKVFPWPMETASNDWETGFRSHLKAIEPVTAQTAALALNWTFYKAGKPTYVAQVVLIPTEKGPALMRLQKLWAKGTTPYPEWMVSTQGRQPNEWPDMFLPWAKLLAVFQRRAMPEKCPGLPIADDTVLKRWIPAPYRAMQVKTLSRLKTDFNELCKYTYDADSVTMMPVRQHFNLVNASGQIRGGVLLEFKSGATGLVITNPQFKQIGVPE